MRYKAELEFFKKLLDNFHLAHTVITRDRKEIPDGSLGIYRLCKKEEDYMERFWKLAEKYEDNVVYRINSACMYRSLLLRLPDTAEEQFMLIGPYMLAELSREMILDIAELISFPQDQYRRLEQFYMGLPRIADESVLLSAMNTFGECIWGSIAAEEPRQVMKILEERYEGENRLIQAVAKGQAHRAEAFLNGFTIRWVENRTPDSLRNAKNYLIILNTLLRKAVESADVHPIHIDELSSRFARKIEVITSEKDMIPMCKEMIRKYCLLVTNHSMKSYSLLVRKVLTQIDADLTADLSLKTRAAELGVNASYLSTLFKKETGKTLTEYVTGKRIEHAVFLLNSTRLQIQSIAQRCGMSDVNYFTRLFKSLVGKTPKEYRDSIYGRGSETSGHK